MLTSGICSKASSRMCPFLFVASRASGMEVSEDDGKRGMEISSEGRL